ncbi:MAG: histidine phosphatase family protein [Rhizomicrobium sp.]
MKRLLLLRHAKAVPGDAKTDDRERTLNARGVHDAPLLGAEIHHRRYVPELAFCSTARRTVETWERLAPEFDALPAVTFLDALYLASPKTILKLVQSADNEAGTLLVLGHNPGLQDCAAALARRSPAPEERARLERMRDKFPTCALAVFDFEIAHWRDVEHGTGRLTDFIRPRDLNGG